MKRAAVPRQPAQFDVWWVELPDPIGRRPVLLLGRTSSFSYLSRILAVEVTTTIRGIPQEVTLGPQEGLPRRCVANLDTMRTIPRHSVHSYAGRLRQHRHPEVKKALGHVLCWPELTGI